MKRISIQQAVVDLIDETDASVSRNIPLLIKWAKRIESRIGSAKGYKLRAVMVTASGNVLKLPEDCIKLHQVYKGDYSNEMVNFYKEFYSSGTIKETENTYYEDGEEEFVWTNLTKMVFIPPLWDDWGDEVNLVDDYDGEEFTLWYSCIELDQEGYPIVNESHIEAIKIYLKYKLSEKRLWRVFSGEKMLRQGEMAFVGDLRSEYRREVRNARALDSEETELERDQY